MPAVPWIRSTNDVYQVRIIPQSPITNHPVAGAVISHQVTLYRQFFRLPELGK